MAREGRAFEYERLTVEEAQADYPDLWATVIRDFIWLTPDRQARIVALVVGTCPDCHAWARGCQCGNDE